MADTEWFVIPGEGEFPNEEAAMQHARGAARRSDRTVEVFRMTRTLVRSFQRKVTIEEHKPSA